MMRILLTLLLVLALPAAARNADGTLSLIERPNCGAPAITVPGGTFSVQIREKAALSLVVKGGKRPLRTRWDRYEQGLYMGTCAVPADVAPGACTLEAVHQTATDTNLGVVHIVAAIPDTYTIAQVAGPNLRSSDVAPLERTRVSLAQAHEAGAAFAVVTGSLAAETGEYPKVVQVLSDAPLPVFVCPEAAVSPSSARYFGQGGHVFRFGPDGYLAFDTTGTPISSGEGRQDAWLYEARRQIRDARWSVGLTQHYSLAMGMRAQLTLFVDDPLDALLTSTVPFHEGEPLPMAPWGRTVLYPLSAQQGDGWRLLQMGANIREVPVSPAESPDTSE